MTILQSRPSRPAPAAVRRGSTAPPAGGRDTPRPLSVTAAVAGVGCALGGLVVLQAIALTGWFLADGGSHGTTTGALRIGADAWLAGHGAHLTFGGVDYTVVPLGLTVLLVWAAFRAGRWAGLSAARPDDAETWLGIGILTCGYLVVAVLTAVFAGDANVHSSLPRAIAGALVVGGVGGGAGVLVGAGRGDVLTRRLPAWVPAVVRGAATIVVGLYVCSAALVLTSFVLHVGSVMSLASELGLKPGDTVMLCLASAVAAPNAVAYGSAYLLGPGFAVGTGTAVSPTLVSLGPLPSFPLLAALPDHAAPSWLGTSLLAVPPLVAAVSVALVVRRTPARSWDAAAVRGIGSGVLAAVLVALLGALAGGALGDGRMADIGPSTPRMLVSGALALGLGGLAGGLAGALRWRRPPAAPDDAEPTVSLEPRVLVPARPDEPTVVLDTGEESALEHTTEVDLTEPVTDPDSDPAEDAGLRELRARFLEQTRRSSTDDA